MDAYKKCVYSCQRLICREQALEWVVMQFTWRWTWQGFLHESKAISHFYFALNSIHTGVYANITYFGLYIHSKQIEKKLYFILIRQKFCMIFFPPKAVTFYFGRHFLSNKARVDQELLWLPKRGGKKTPKHPKLNIRPIYFIKWERLLLLTDYLNIHEQVSQFRWLYI